MDFAHIGSSNVADAGGKGAHLGELSRIEGVRVPDGFCVTTDAFQQVVAGAPEVDALLCRLARVTSDDRAEVRALSAGIRRAVENLPVPGALSAAITGSLARLGKDVSCAVRSSATAEDLPNASFAGQQDSYLNVVGPEAVLRHVRRCWASLFTERAVTYRCRHGFDHRKVRMAVVVQRMVFPDAAGMLFTADPVTSNRRVATVEAGWGLGEALVSGLAAGDVYRVRDGRVVTTEVATKPRSVRASPDGGTRDVPVEPQRQTQPALTEAQAVGLVQLGRRVEAHFGRPQDIEWCLVGDEFHLVQSRPITTLFPLPAMFPDPSPALLPDPAAGGGDPAENRVYVSVGHQQMMTDAMKPLGLSLWQLTTPRPMYEAGGRLFVDVAPVLATPAGRANLIDTLGRSDPLVRDALRTVLDRDGFLSLRPDDGSGAAPDRGPVAGPIETDPAVVTELIRRNQESVATLRRTIREVSGPALFDFILADMAELKRVVFDPRSLQMIMAGMHAAWWLNEHLETWLGERNAADALTQSVSHNVTSEMGLELLDVADVVRPHTELVAFLRRVADEAREGDGFLDELAGLPGGQEAADALRGYLDRYGMRCAGEIDITRTRWSEQPAMLLPTLLGNIRNFGPGAGRQRFVQGRRESQEKERELLTRLRALPDGEEKAAETKKRIDCVRTFAGFREYPKYFMISRYFAYKQALLREAELLVRSGVLREKEDIYFLRLQELQEVVRTGGLDTAPAAPATPVGTAAPAGSAGSAGHGEPAGHGGLAGLVRRRREEFRAYECLTPPRVHTSDGEVVNGRYRSAGLPSGALAGLPVSAGTVEGRARVVTDMARADLEAGDILVTAFTDPSWTPLFVAAAGLVTEVGGLMTHGAVIAREYGLPAVVGVEQATRLIRDGQRIRVHGTEGYVEILADDR